MALNSCELGQISLDSLEWWDRFEVPGWPPTPDAAPLWPPEVQQIFWGNFINKEVRMSDNTMTEMSPMGLDHGSIESHFDQCSMDKIIITHISANSVLPNFTSRAL